MGATGAPWPLRAISELRKSQMVVIPVRAAMAAPSPIWVVKCSLGKWKIVWPCDAMREGMKEGCWVRKLRTACPIQWPRSACALASSRAEALGSDWRVACQLAGKGMVSAARSCQA